MADFYGNLISADAYHEAHGNDAIWNAVTVDDVKRTAALLIASEWIDANYRTRFPGWKTGRRSQLREWPRSEAYDVYDDHIPSGEIPSQIDDAVYEVALRQIASAGSLFKDWTPGKDIKQVSIDGALSVTFAGATSLDDVQLSIPKITAILSPILLAGGALSSLSGRSSRI